MKKKKCYNHIFETTRGYHEAGPCTNIVRNTDETSVTPDLTARSTKQKNYNNQTTIKTTTLVQKPGR